MVSVLVMNLVLHQTADAVTIVEGKLTVYQADNFEDNHCTLFAHLLSDDDELYRITLEHDQEDVRSINHGTFRLRKRADKDDAGNDLYNLREIIKNDDEDDAGDRKRRLTVVNPGPRSVVLIRTVLVDTTINCDHECMYEAMWGPNENAASSKSFAAASNGKVTFPDTFGGPTTSSTSTTETSSTETQTSTTTTTTTSTVTDTETSTTTSTTSTSSSTSTKLTLRRDRQRRIEFKQHAVQHVDNIITVYINQTESDYDFCDWYQLALDAFAIIRESLPNATDPEVYDHMAMFIPKLDCDWAGLGVIGCDATHGIPCLAFTNVPGPRVLTHELGHNVGMGHAGTPPAEYGDCSDIMGCGGTGFNMPHVMFMGWTVDNTVRRYQNFCGQGSVQNITLRAVAEFDNPDPFISSMVILPGLATTLYLSLRAVSGHFETAEPGGSLSAEFVNRLSVHECSDITSRDLEGKSIECLRTTLKGTQGIGERGIGDGVKYEVLSVNTTEHTLTISVDLCHENAPGYGECGSLAAVPSCDCPVELDLPACNEVGFGELCEGDGECGTDGGLNNCDGYDIYRKTDAPLEICRNYSSYTVLNESHFLSPSNTSCKSRLDMTDDDIKTGIDIGFAFPYYCDLYDTVHISSNGWLMLGNVAPVCDDYFFQRCFQPGQSGNIITTRWMDINPEYGGGVYYYLSESDDGVPVFVVSYEDVYEFGTQNTGPVLNFQMQLFADGRVVLTSSESELSYSGEKTLISGSAAFSQTVDVTAERPDSGGFTISFAKEKSECEADNSGTIATLEQELVLERTKVANLTDEIEVLRARVAQLEECRGVRGRRFLEEV